MMGHENSGRTAWIWTPEREQQLRDMWDKQGLPASQICAILGVSRSAICAKVARLRLSKRRGSTPRPKFVERKSPHKASAYHPRAKAEKPMTIKPKLLAVPLPGDTRRLHGEAWQPLPGTTPVPLAELETGMCKWPVTEGSPFLFCGAATAEGKPYCAHHHALAVGDGTAAEQAVDMMLEAA